MNKSEFKMPRFLMKKDKIRLKVKDGKVYDISGMKWCKTDECFKYLMKGHKKYYGEDLLTSELV